MLFFFFFSHICRITPFHLAMQALKHWCSLFDTIYLVICYNSSTTALRLFSVKLACLSWAVLRSSGEWNLKNFWQKKLLRHMNYIAISKSALDCILQPHKCNFIGKHSPQRRALHEQKGVRSLGWRSDSRCWSL